MYEKYLSAIDEHSEEICGISDAIYDNPELGFREHFSSGILKDALRGQGCCRYGYATYGRPLTDRRSEGGAF